MREEVVILATGVFCAFVDCDTCDNFSTVGACGFLIYWCCLWYLLFLFWELRC
jgi:hypothetical protein